MGENNRRNLRDETNITGTQWFQHFSTTEVSNVLLRNSKKKREREKT